MLGRECGKPGRLRQPYFLSNRRPGRQAKPLLDLAGARRAALIAAVNGIAAGAPAMNFITQNTFYHGWNARANTAADGALPRPEALRERLVHQRRPVFRRRVRRQEAPPLDHADAARLRLCASGKPVLPPGFEHHHTHRIRQIHAARAGQHRQAQAVAGAEYVAGDSGVDGDEVDLAGAGEDRPSSWRMRLLTKSEESSPQAGQTKRTGLAAMSGERSKAYLAPHEHWIFIGVAG